ncbi:MAG TPA: hypothetical protein VGT44_10790, partial [Ktedonobacteraceae bacterium]|nr:hypothetical protein [Ktedonobacteraceae bacterium]
MPHHHAEPTHQLHISRHPTAPLHHQGTPQQDHPAQHPRHEQEPGHEHEQAHHRAEHTGRPHHRLRLRSHGTHTAHAATASKVAVGTATKWLIVALTAVVVIATSGVVLVLASAPGLSLSGSSSSISSGGTLHIHGKGFLPGGSVTLTLDNGQHIAFQRNGLAKSAGQGSVQEADVLFALDRAAASTNASIPVSVTGTFDADVTAPSSWSPGQHIIHASEGFGSRSADLQFTLLASPAKLVVTPTAIAFTAQAGTKESRSLQISNAGQATLTWTAATDGAKWLSLQGNGGQIGFNGQAAVMDVTADANHLKVGTYPATITVSSNGGNQQVAVALQVIQATGKKQAQLDVSPRTLDFGLLSPGQQLTQPLTVGNLGTAALLWHASAVNASWLSLSTSSGSLQPGAIPQAVQVTVNTNGLAAGSYAATITVASNAGTVQIPVAFDVLGTTPTPLPPSPTAPPPPSPTTPPPPSPTAPPPPSPTTPPPPSPTAPPPPSPTVPPSPTAPPPTTWSVSPTSLDLTNCTSGSGPTYMCFVTLTEGSSSPGNINWSVSDSLGTAGFSQSSGTLTPGGSVQITI